MVVVEVVEARLVVSQAYEALDTATLAAVVVDFTSGAALSRAHVFRFLEKSR